MNAEGEVPTSVGCDAARDELAVGFEDGSLRIFKMAAKAQVAVDGGCGTGFVMVVRLCLLL